MNSINVIHYGKAPTRQALALKRELEKNGISVRQEQYDGHKHIDLVIPKAKLNIEVDGIHHLTDPKQIIADLNRGYHSSKSGFATIHIPNEVIDRYLEKIANALAKVAKIREQDRTVYVILKSSKL